MYEKSSAQKTSLLFFKVMRGGGFDGDFVFFIWGFFFVKSEPTVL